MYLSLKHFSINKSFKIEFSKNQFFLIIKKFISKFKLGKTNIHEN